MAESIGTSLRVRIDMWSLDGSAKQKSGALPVTRELQNASEPVKVHALIQEFWPSRRAYHLQYCRAYQRRSGL
jgi:hypothetical protein